MVCVCVCVCVCVRVCVCLCVCVCVCVCVCDFINADWTQAQLKKSKKKITPPGPKLKKKVKKKTQCISILYHKFSMPWRIVSPLSPGVKKEKMKNEKP